MKLRKFADQIHSRFSNTTGGTVFSFMVFGMLYILTKIPYFNLLFTIDINFGIFWMIFAYVYRIPVQITLIVSGVLWMVTLVLVIIGSDQIAEMIVNNIYVLLVAAVIQQAADLSHQKS